ncbi:MAG: hypothetical protein OER95_19790, partial [Acidimicrobiia bacterium]|nr:hypothetical protein [Acidimicrobiia bacterium]
LTELRRRRAAALGLAHVDGEVSHRPRGADPGVNAADAYRRWRSIDEGATDSGRWPPPSVAVPGRARTLPHLAVAPPADSGVDEGELRDLVADAARRAVAMLSGEGTSGLNLSVGADVARRAVTGDVAAIASATDRAADELAAAARAFRHGGPAGMAAADHRWDASADQLRPGVDALTAWATRTPSAGGRPPRVVQRANTVSAGLVQLRLDETGTWWRFDVDDQLGWLLGAPGSDDPAELL